MRGKWLLIGATVILLAVAAGALSVLRHGRPAKLAPSPAVEQPVQNVKEASLMGTLRARNLVDVEADVDGIVESLAADVGQEVHEGDILAHIASQGLESEQQRTVALVEGARATVGALETAVASARLEASRARADASRARSEAERTASVFQRQQLLHREGATPRLAFEKAEAEYRTAQTEFQTLDEVARNADERVNDQVRSLDIARKLLDSKTKDLESAQLNLAAADIRSPVDGIVVTRKGEVGTPVDPANRGLFQIAVDLEQLEAVLDPAPPLLPRFHPGQPALVVAADVPGDGVPGQVRAVENNQVVVEFVSPTAALKPGMSVQVRVKME